MSYTASVAIGPRMPTWRIVVSGSSWTELDPVIHVSGASRSGQPWLVTA